MANQIQTFYHYTNEKGHAAIKDSGRIYVSTLTGRDASFGAGVYLTQLSPDMGKEVVAENNWSHVWKSMISDGRMDYVIQLQIPLDRLQRARSHRNVYIHKNEIHLDEYEHAFLKCDWDVQVVSETLFAYESFGYEAAEVMNPNYMKVLAQLFNKSV